MYRVGPLPYIPFPPDLILYVNFVTQGAPKFFKTLAPRLTVLDVPYLADACSRTVRPIDLHNLRPIPRIQSVMMLPLQIFPIHVYPLAEISQVLQGMLSRSMRSTFQ
jgi:hypothetical protein